MRTAGCTARRHGCDRVHGNKKAPVIGAFVFFGVAVQMDSVASLLLGDSWLDAQVAPIASSGEQADPLAAALDTCVDLATFAAVDEVPHGSQSAAPITIRRASTDTHLIEAGALLRKMYGWRGYHLHSAHARPRCTTLIASQEACTLATLTVGIDSPTGLVASDLYPDHVSRLRRHGAKLCEVMRLAVDQDVKSHELLAKLFHVAYALARQIYGRTDMLVEVNPRHTRFYARMLGFRRIGDVRICPRVNAPAVLMWLPLQHAEEQIALRGTGKDIGTRSLYRLFFTPQEEAVIAARLRAIR